MTSSSGGVADVQQSLFEPLQFRRGRAMPNRFMLAPLTNLQSHADGTLSDEEFTWLTMRATGGFGATMTCAAHVQEQGQGFPGQLGVFSDDHVEGLSKLAAAITSAGSVALAQLHHAGIRAPRDLIGQQPAGPSEDDANGARAMSTGEVEELIDDFASAAQRADQAGFDGVELHGAHNYVICAFLSPQFNRRTDRFGGDAENRARLLTETIAEVRQRCRSDFILGVRLSPERFGLELVEMIDLARQLLNDDDVDFLDMSLWDCAKRPEDPEFADRLLIEYFTSLARGDTKLGVAGKLYDTRSLVGVLAAGADFPLVGRAAVVHHDFPRRSASDPDFAMAPLPVTRDHLRAEGLSERFIGYMSTWKGFVADE